MKYKLILPTLILIAISLTTGCYDTNIKVRANIISGPSINQNKKGSPSPLEVRIYYLTNEQAFQNASYLDLFRRDQDLLKNDLVRKPEIFVIRAGQTIPYRTNISDKAKYIGIAAAFRIRNNKQWKIIKRTNLFGYEYLTIKIDNFNLVLIHD